MLDLLLALALVSGVAEDPPKTEKAVKAEPAKSSEPAKPSEPKAEAKAEPPAKKRTSVAVPDETPAPAKPPSKPKPVVDPRVAEAEARAARLAQENARLQQELAKREPAGSAKVANAEEAVAELQAGNLRFAEGRRVRTLMAMQDPDLRRTLAGGQAPFAVIVTCADSRLMDNLIFDQELGRLFTVREAGNCPDTQGIASVEYAVEHLGAKLVVVLGHTKCGAVKAVAESHGQPLPGHLWSLQAAMVGLAEALPEDPNAGPDRTLRDMERVNAQRQAQVILDRSEIVRHLAGQGKVKVLPALYDLDTGRVTWLALPSRAPQAAHH